jgi:hypothetical protein
VQNPAVAELIRLPKLAVVPDLLLVARAIKAKRYLHLSQVPLLQD